MNDGLAGHEAASSVAGSMVADALPFRRDGDAPFPTAGAALLLLLLGVAAWAWWVASRRGAAHGIVALPRARFWKTPAADSLSARVVGSTRLGPAAMLHVIAWRGTEVLVAINGSSEPVVLGRHPDDDATRSTIAQ